MKWFRPFLSVGVIVIFALPFAAARVQSAVIYITPADSYTKIEAAKAGDEVIIGPGTYAFRLHLTAKASASNPINIHAQDPNNKPVWDLGASLVENAPGSYGAGDRGRGGWQVDGGANYHISGIVFTGCHTASQNSAGLRYYNGTTGLHLKDCVFRNNDNGISGGSQNSDATVEYCEFDGNGNLAATSPTHNMYIYGGTFILRYCYVHDSLQAQNFHIRAQSATLEYNWFARAKSYEGDLMTDGDLSGSGPFAQSMLLRGNVFLQSTNPDNHSQILVIFNDGGLTNETMSMQLINNTCVANGIPGNGGNAAFVHLSNADGTQMSAQLFNNLIYGTTRPSLVENASKGIVSGANNWLPVGVSPGPLMGSLFSASPGFRNAGAKDFSLSPGSACIGGANQTIQGLPIREYYRDETTAREYRIRTTAMDIGAFESTTTGAGFGPYDAGPAPTLRVGLSGGNIIFSWPSVGTDFVLDQTTDLNNLWTPVEGPYATDLSAFQVAIAPPARTHFYRLRKP
ncbi:MAG: hypothetical protein JWR26_3570 [Pedosphaera sp.]|nr:hypothetical protein [Pedosphaera sp.]